jgi:hypothetical protein
LEVVAFATEVSASIFTSFLTFHIREKYEGTRCEIRNFDSVVVDESGLVGCYGLQRATRHIPSSSVVGTSCNNELLSPESNLMMLSTCFSLGFPPFRHVLQQCELFSQLHAFGRPSGMFMKCSHHCEPTKTNLQFHNLFCQDSSHTSMFGLVFETGFICCEIVLLEGQLYDSFYFYLMKTIPLCYINLLQ